MRRIFRETAADVPAVAWLVIAVEDSDSQIIQKGSQHFRLALSQGSFNRDTPSQITIKWGAHHVRILLPARWTLRAPGAIRENLENPEMFHEKSGKFAIRQSFAIHGTRNVNTTAAFRTEKWRFHPTTYKLAPKSLQRHSQWRHKKTGCLEEFTSLSTLM